MSTFAGNQVDTQKQPLVAPGFVYEPLTPNNPDLQQQQVVQHYLPQTGYNP